MKDTFLGPFLNMRKMNSTSKCGSISIELEVGGRQTLLRRKAGGKEVKIGPLMFILKLGRQI